MACRAHDSKGSRGRSVCRRQIPPHWIHAADQLILFCPRPALDLLFRGERVARIGKRLIKHQLFHMIFLREAFDNMVSMLIHPPLLIICHAGVQHLICLIRHHIYIIHGRRADAIPWARLVRPAQSARLVRPRRPRAPAWAPARPGARRRQPG